MEKEKRQYVLFSPVSGADPASPSRDGTCYYDGPMLNIARTYQPIKVYLYFTETFRANEEADHRYTEMLKHVCGHLKDEDIILKSPSEDTASSIALFDTLAFDFSAILHEIHAAYDECTILLNLSSGTPQMQAALYLLAPSMGFSVSGVQVDAPNIGTRPRSTGVSNFNSEAVRELLVEERSKNPGTRQHSIVFSNVRELLQRSNIERLIASYDYTAALKLCGKKSSISSDVLWLLRLVCAHLEQDKEKLKSVCQSYCDSHSINFAGEDIAESLYTYGYEPFYSEEERPYLCPGKEAEAGPDAAKTYRERRECYDYILYLDTLVKSSRYSDFCRALSPVLTTLMELYLRHNGHDICEELELTDGSKRILRRRDQWMADIEKNRPFIEYLDKALAKESKGSTGYRDGPLSAFLLLEYMKFIKSTESEAIKNFDSLREVEGTIRNIAAHQMSCINDQSIKKQTRLNSSEIIDILKREFARAVGAQPDELKWDELQRINVQIHDKLAFHIAKSGTRA